MTTKRERGNPFQVVTGLGEGNLGGEFSWLFGDQVDEGGSNRGRKETLARNGHKLKKEREREGTYQKE